MLIVLYSLPNSLLYACCACISLSDVEDTSEMDSMWDW